MAFKDMAPTTFGTWNYPMAVAAINAGEIACLNASGYLVPGSVATGLLAVGIAKKSVDNSGGSAGDLTCPVMTSFDSHGGIRAFPLSNSAGGAAVVQGSRVCWVAGPNSVRVDDNGGTCSRAGKVHAFDDDGNVLVIFDMDDDATDVSALDARVESLELGAITMQAVNATLASGTITINSGITVSAASEVMPVLIGAITGSTNFASLSELKASRVNGAPGVGTVVIRALGSDGALDADAAGAIRVLIFTPAA